MLNSLAAKALLGVAALGLVGGTTALAASPAASAAVQNATRGKHRHQAKDVARGTIIKLNEDKTEMTIERHQRRDSKAASTKPATDDVTFVLNGDTKVFRWGDKDHNVGRDALKVGERVGVKFEEKDGKKIAKKVLILPDARAGILVSKDNDGQGHESLKLRTRKGDVITVTVDPAAKFFEGRRGRDQGSFNDMRVGDRVLALGEEDNAHNFDAKVIRYSHPDHGRAATQPQGTNTPPH